MSFMLSNDLAALSTVSVPRDDSFGMMTRNDEVIIY